MGADPFKNEGKSQAARWGNRVLLGLFAVVAGAMVVLIALSFIVPPVLRGVVADYTEREPLEFPDSSISQAEHEALDARYEAFNDAIENTDPRTMEITERELNGLLAENDDVKDKVRVSFRDGLLHMKMSVPIEDDLNVGPWRGEMRGRYLNGTAVLKTSIVSDGLSVKLTDFLVKGEPVPGWMHSVLQHGIDRLDWLHSEDVAEAVSKLESIAIEDGRLALHPKR